MGIIRTALGRLRVFASGLRRPDHDDGGATGAITLEAYIRESWRRLLHHSLDAASDPKVEGGTRPCVYIPSDENADAVRAMIAARRSNGEHPDALDVRILPDDMNVTQDHGILYLPRDYVVPGGRFKEMYAWDSYWIILGLLQDGCADIARGMVDNFVYQIRHYGGKVLNANRTYYLTRSQPPLLAPMATAVLPSLNNAERGDFLRDVVGAISLEYEGFWKKDRYNEKHGMFHYGNIAQGALGPCAESLSGERDEKGLSHYDKLLAYFQGLPPDHEWRRRFLDGTGGALSPEAFAADRAMRESGFDTSMHMGPYGLETLDYHPVCLNTLLYVQCQMMEGMCRELGQNDRADYFHKEAGALRANIQKYMWNENAGLFCGYNHRGNRQSSLPFLTSVYPLWAGIATPPQAARFRDNLPLFEAGFGVKSASQQTGCQWDAPFMWAPLVYFTVAGLHRYGFDEDARRIANKFIDTVRRVYERRGVVFEKYNADTGDCETKSIINVGYSENAVGFGWTNGAVSVMQKWLRRPGQLTL